jgi:hypothetical protein
MTLEDGVIDAFLVIRPITGEGGDRPVDLLEQRANLGGIIRLRAGQHRRDDLARVGIDPEVQGAPGPTRFRAMLLAQPFARATQL